MPKFIDLTGKTFGLLTVIGKSHVNNGLDRVDSSRPHTLDNCVPCCFLCNHAKQNMTVDKFLNWIENIYSHSIIRCNNSALFYG